MYVSIFMISLNMLFIYLFNLKKKNNNEYEKEKNIFNKLKLKKINRVVNIGYILINVIYYIIILLSVGIDTIKNFHINLILYIITVIVYLITEAITKKKKIRFKLIDKKLLSRKEYMYIIVSYILFILEKTSISYKFANINEQNFINTFNIVLYILAIILIILSSLFIIIYIKNNSKYFIMTNTDENYLEDIKFYKKIEIRKIFNHVIYITAYIVFFYANIPYIIIIYFLFLILLLYFAYNKIKKIRNESNRVYRTITIAKNKPGILYAFLFTKDLLLLKKLLIFILMFISSIIVYYGLGESIFSFLFISIYLILLYTIIEDKVYLIRYLSSLNNSFIDEKQYPILQNKKIDYIESINILGIKLYKLIVIDTICYESNIIIYDPELIINNIDIRINKSNILDYITLEAILYEE